MLIYVLAVFHRSSLGVAGLAATDVSTSPRPSSATFTMLQLLVYAGMQVPVGLLIDRFGPRSVLLVGRGADDRRPGRVRVRRQLRGRAGRPGVRRHRRRDDVHLRAAAGQQLVPAARRIPLVTQLTGTLGQLGAIAAAIPMTWALGAPRLDAGLPRSGRGSAWSSSWRCCPSRRRAPANGTSRGPPAVPADAYGGTCATPGRTRAPGSGSGCTSPRSSAPPHEPALGLPVLRARRGRSAGTAGSC